MTTSKIDKLDRLFLAASGMVSKCKKSPNCDGIICLCDDRPVGRIKEMHPDGSVEFEPCEPEIMQAFLEIREKVLSSIARLEEIQRGMWPGKPVESLRLTKQILELKRIVEMHLDLLGARLKG